MPPFENDKPKDAGISLFQAGSDNTPTARGKCIDNGPMESFWGFLKTEMYYLRKFNTFEELKTAVEEYIYYYNNNRYQEKRVVYHQWSITRK